MTNIIFNADDFGYSRAVNYGIVDAHSKGVVTSTTLMANMPGFDHALELIQQYPTLGIGVHLTLTCGYSLTKGDSLVDKDNAFKKLKVYEQGYQVKEDELYAEWKAQIDKVQDAGIEITHLDSHHHMHTFEGNIKVFERLALEYNLPVRNNYAKQDGIIGVSYFEPEFDFIGEDRQSSNFTSNLAKLYQEVEQSMKQHKTMEVMVHPAYIDEALYTSSAFVFPRIRQVEILTSSSIKKWLKDNKATLISYKQVKEML